MVHTQTVANTFIFLALQEHIDISPIQLQKLTYFLYKEYLQRTNEKLFNEPSENGKYGPFLPSLHYKFSSFGDKPVIQFYRTATGHAEIIDLNLKNILSDSVKKIWEVYKFI